MAFYFRKFRQSLRLIPATKSLGYSTRLNEGERSKELHDCEQVCSKHHNQVPSVCSCPRNLEFSVDAALISPSSALVPLSVRDMALVLLPRLEESHSLPSDNPDVFSCVTKTVPLTCDDILVGGSVSHYNSNAFKASRSASMERLLEDIHYPDCCSHNKVYNSSNSKNQTHSLLPLHDLDAGELFVTSNAHSSQITSEASPHTGEPLSYSGCLFCSDGSGDKGKKSSKDGPSSEQLHSVKDRVEEMVLRMLTSRHDYSLLDKNVVLENNLFGDNSIKRGLTAYALELLKLRFKIHSRFSSATMEVLNTTIQEESGVIKIHWRLKGLPQMEVLKFWRLFQERDEISKDDWKWFEAFSYFHIGKDGMVHKHRIDRMLPGSEEPDKLSVKIRKLLNPAKPLVN